MMDTLRPSGSDEDRAGSFRLCETKKTLSHAKDGAMSTERGLVYVVDDDISMREAVECVIRSAGLRVKAFASAEEFLSSPRPSVPSCLVLDMQLPGLSGLRLQQELAKADVQIPIIFISGHGDIPMS